MTPGVGTWIVDQAVGMSKRRQEANGSTTLAFDPIQTLTRIRTGKVIK
jgi:hypothetical protein